MPSPKRILLSIGLALSLAGLAQAETPGPMTLPPETLKVPKTWEAPGFKAEGMEALFYEGMPYKGKPTRVFAWIGIPEVKPGTKVPGIVLVHGGGGTAFEDWVKLWVGRGYAAIAMDTCGTVPRGTYGKWEPHEHSGPRGNSFDGSNEAKEDQWPYHAVSDVILAHSLLRSRPEVDADRIGLTGISWGGYLTCISSGLDERFKFAVPVYGCGFLGNNSAWKAELDKLGDRGQRWLAMWDPSHYLPAGKMPKLWLNGTNDNAYPMDSHLKSVRVAGGESTLCIRIRMVHGHYGPGENPDEIRVFANSILKGGHPLARVTETGTEGSSTWAKFKAVDPIVKAELILTKDRNTWNKREWSSLPAKVEADGSTVRAEIPAGTTAYYLNLLDAEGHVVSTEFKAID